MPSKKITLTVLSERHLSAVPKAAEVAIVGKGRTLYAVRSYYHRDQFVIADGIREAYDAFVAVTVGDMREFYEGDDPGGFDQWPVPEDERDCTVQEPEKVEVVATDVVLSAQLEGDALEAQGEERDAG